MKKSQIIEKQDLRMITHETLKGLERHKEKKDQRPLKNIKVFVLICSSTLLNLHQICPYEVYKIVQFYSFSNFHSTTHFSCFFFANILVSVISLNSNETKNLIQHEKINVDQIDNFSALLLSLKTILFNSYTKDMVRKCHLQGITLGGKGNAHQP